MSKHFLLKSIILCGCFAMIGCPNSVRTASASNEPVSEASAVSHFYTDEELCQLALEDYISKYGTGDEFADSETMENERADSGTIENENTGNEAAGNKAADSRTADNGLTAAAADNGDGTVTIQIYQNMGDHNSTAAWYQVDRITGEGIHVGSGTLIDLTNGSPDVDITFLEDESAILPDNYYECMVDDSEYTSNLLLSPKVPVSDFHVVLLEYVETIESEENLDSAVYAEPEEYTESVNAHPSFRITEKLFSSDSLTSEMPLVVHAELSETIPSIGIMYVDRNDEKKLYTFSLSGLDGDPLLTEGTIYAE